MQKETQYQNIGRCAESNFGCDIHCCLTNFLKLFMRTRPAQYWGQPHFIMDSGETLIFHPFLREYYQLVGGSANF